MKPFFAAAGAALFALTLAPSEAAASAPGYVTTNLNVRAGPGTQFPAVAVFPTGSRVNVIGCTSGFGWCDVTGRGVRGWVSARYLDIRHQNRRVRVPTYGAQIGLPIITFHIGSYWDRHYRDRSWYHQRSRFAPPPSRAAPPRERQRQPSHRERRDDRRGEWRSR